MENNIMKGSTTRSHLKIITLCIFTLLTLFTLNTQSVSSERQKIPDDLINNLSDSNQKISDNWINTEIYRATKQTANETARIANYTYIALIISAFVAVLSSFSVYFLQRTLKTALNSQHSTILELQPWLSIVKKPILRVYNDQGVLFSTIEIDLTNLGKTPAYNITVSFKSLWLNLIDVEERKYYQISDLKIKPSCDKIVTTLHPKSTETHKISTDLLTLNGTLLGSDSYEFEAYYKIEGTITFNDMFTENQKNKNRSFNFDFKEIHDDDRTLFDKSDSFNIFPEN